MGYIEELQRQKMFLYTFFTAKCEKFINFALFRFSQFVLIINKARKLEFAESNLIMQNVFFSLSVSLSLSLSLPLCVCVCVCVYVCVCVCVGVCVCRLGFLSFSFSFTFYLSDTHTLSLSLSLTLFLMPHFSCCYVACCHHLLLSPHGHSIKLKLASLNRC